jgi:hypothetical protein
MILQYTQEEPILIWNGNKDINRTKYMILIPILEKFLDPEIFYLLWIWELYVWQF